MIDGFGRTVLAVQRNRDPGGPIVQYRTRSRYDIRGNLITLVDPLSRVAFTHVYDFANRPLRSNSIDAGIRTTVLDVVGNVIEQRDSKGALILRAYDRLNRPQLVWARNNSSGRMTLREDLEYGDEGNRELARQSNRLGRLAVHYDEAGCLTFAAYDFKGNVLEKVRQVIADAQILGAMESATTPAPSYQVDWQPPPGTSFRTYVAALLDRAPYETSVAYDALNRIKWMDYPRNVEGERKRLVSGYNRAGALRAVALNDETFVAHIAYNAKGQRTLIAYGNGVMTRYAYEPDTFRLARLRTERFTPGTAPNSYRPVGNLPTGEPLQDFAYRHDLVGNILEIRERVQECGVLNAPGGRDALDRRFTYDPLYRLISATGRESNQVPAPRPWANECWNEYIYGSRQTSDQQHAADQTRPYTEGYEYDAAGNVTRLRHGSNGGPGWSRHFGMGGLNPAQWAGEWPEHLDDQRLRQSPASNQLTHVGDNNPEQGQTHGFDGNGNLEWELSNRHFVWDYADRLIGFADRVGNECQPTKDACYLYDAGGMRVKKVVRNQQPQVETMVYVDQNFEHRRRRAPPSAR